MATLAISLGLASVGNFLLPGIGGQIGFAAGGLLANALFTEDIKNEGPRINDAAVTSSAYGQMLPKVWGVFPVAGNIIDASAVREVSTTTTTGGKGGPEISTTTYSYYGDLDVAIHNGQIDAVLQIRANGKIIYDASPDASVVRPDWLNFTLYKGTDTQNPDPTFQSLRGAGNVPGYRGVAHIVFKDFPFGEFGNSFAVSFEFLIAVSATTGATLANTTVLPSAETADYSGGFIEQSTGLLIFSQYHGVGAGDLTYGVVAVDPYSREVVWQTDADGIKGYEFVTPKPKLVSTPTGVIAIPGEIICVKGLRDSDQTLVRIDPFSGVVISESGVVAASTVSVISLDYDWYDENVGASCFLMLDRGTFVGYDFYTCSEANNFANLTDIDPPSGRVFTTVFKSNGKGNLLIALADTYSSPSVFSIAQYDTFAQSFSTETVIPSTAKNITPINDGWIVVYDQSPLTFAILDTDGALVETVNFNTDYGISEAFNICTAVSYFCGVLYDSSENAILIQGESNLYKLRLDLLDQNPESINLTEEYAAIYHKESCRIWYGQNGGNFIRSANICAASGETITLDQIVSDICLDGTSLESSDIDVSALQPITVQGFGIQKPIARRNAISSLQTAYLFDYVPRNGILTGILRGGASSTTLDVDLIGAHIYGSSPPPAWRVTRRPGLSLPDQVEISFIDPDHNYEAGTQIARRQNTNIGTIERLQLPVVLSNDEAAQIADIILHLAHIESEQYSTTTMPSTIDNVVPAAVLSTDYNGVSYTYRVTSANIVDGRMIEMNAAREVPSVFNSFAVGGDPRESIGTINILGQTILWPLDIPMLRNIDNSASVYVVANSFTDSWPGAEIQRSNDGLSYVTVDAITSGATIGTVTNAPDTGFDGFWDCKTVLNVRLIDGSLSSESRDLPTYAAWGAHGRWEIIAFVVASQDIDGYWSISEIARGLRDTGHNINQHAVGDQFVILDQAKLSKIGYDETAIGNTEFLRGVTFGKSAATSVPTKFVFEAENLECYAPVALHAYISGSDWILEWMRQDRIYGKAFWQAVNSESSETYTVSILDDVDTIIRTEEIIGTNTFTYTSSMQTSDFGVPVELLNWKVAQNSSIVGEGHYAFSNVGVDFDYPGTIVSDNPIVYYRLEESSGTTMLNASSSGSARDGSYFGTIGFLQPPLIKTGKSIEFDGSSSYATINTNSFGNNWARSVEVCFEINAFPSSGYACLVGHGRDNNDSYHFYLSIGSDQKLHFVAYGAGGAIVLDISGSTLSTGTKYHAICNFSYSAPKEISVYLNGALYGTNTYAVTWSLPISTSSYLSIGKSVSTSYTQHSYFEGLIDEVSVYGYEQDATQRSDHFLRGGIA